MTGYPTRWEQVQLREALSAYETIDPRKSPQSQFAYVDIGAIDRDTNEIASHKVIDGLRAPSRARRVIQVGDTLYSTVRTALRNVAWVDRSHDGALGSTALAILRSNGILDPRLLFHLARSKGFSDVVSRLQEGALYPAVAESKLLGVSIPVPPPQEQLRIVERLETALANLENVGRNIQSSRIEIEGIKRGLFSALLSTYAGNDAPTVPMSALVEDIRYGTSKRCRLDPTLTPVLRIPNIVAGQVSIDDLKHAAFSDDEKRSLELREGDVLVVRSNGSLSLLGASAVCMPEHAGFLFAGYLMRVRVDRTIADPYYISRALQHPNVRLQIARLSKSTSGVRNINSDELMSLDVPLPDIATQRRIVDEMSAHLLRVGNIVGALSGAKQSLLDLEDQVLQAAFSGNFASADPDDEPASSHVAKHLAAARQPTEIWETP